MSWNGEQNCSGCRYWSDMIARAGGATTNIEGDTEALCLAKDGPHSKQYTTAEMTCTAFGRDTHGRVDSPPNYGERARGGYAEQAERKHDNGAPVFAADGTLLDDKGNRSIFDDLDF